MENVLTVGLALVLSALLAIAVLLGALVSKRWAAARGPGIEARTGDLEQRADRLESRLKLLHTEWVDYHSKLDSIVKRGVRLGVLERKEGETEARPSTALTRSDLLKRHREGRTE